MLLLPGTSRLLFQEFKQHISETYVAPVLATQMRGPRLLTEELQNQITDQFAKPQPFQIMVY